MMGIWELASLLLGLLALQYLKQLWSSRNYPPGPFQLPLVGGVWWVRKKFSQDIFIKLAKQYGNIFTIWLGSYPIVILSGYQAVKEGLIVRSEDFAARPVTPTLKALFKKRGIITSNGHIWKQQRRFGQVTLGKLGVGKKCTEHIVEEAAHQLVEIFTLAKGHPIDPILPISTKIFKVVCAVVFGHQSYFQEEEIEKILEESETGIKFAGTISHILYELFPRLMDRLPTPFRKMRAMVDKRILHLREEIARHKEYQMQNEPQDFTDFYLLQMEKSKNDPDSTYNEDNLVQCILDFLVAGTETSSTTLQWALLLMGVHPEIQDKVYKEMENVLGTSQSICYQDRKKMPYTNAVIHEIMRLKYVFPIGVARRSVKDVTMHGYTIPKGTFVVPDLTSVLLDPKQWETPRDFNPQHFLDKDGQFVAREEFLAFGAGPRVCLGEQLARMEIFLFFTHLLRSFRFYFPEGTDQINQDPLVGFLLHPEAYKICAVPR
ncbi:cytochrome P450 2J5-like [Sceloporus undulatus]|uniref:cytochrome P450 2J5-like n=1 Tax=Sceloporus undulatus TaxID=8520 RepID=UPI001C4A9DA8|nr:cytochrome P450 2J5-like [Sceloporus undulatus]